MTAARRTHQQGNRCSYEPSRDPRSRAQPSGSVMRTRSRTRTTHPLTLGIGAVLALSLALVAGPAQAHDELVSTNPADKAQVQTMPDQIVLNFEEPAAKAGSQVIVPGPRGNVALRGPAFLKNTVTQAVQPAPPAGAFTLLCRRA